MSKCRQCGQDMNPVEVMMGPICGTCVRENHERVTTHDHPDWSHEVAFGPCVDDNLTDEEFWAKYGKGNT